MDLSIHNNNKDNNNHIRVVDLSLAKPVSEEKTEDKLKSLLPQLDITALSILTLARLQETAAALTGGPPGLTSLHSLPSLLCSPRRPLPAHMSSSSSWAASS